MSTPRRPPFSEQGQGRLRREGYNQKNVRRLPRGMLKEMELEIDDQRRQLQYIRERRRSGSVRYEVGGSNFSISSVSSGLLDETPRSSTGVSMQSIRVLQWDAQLAFHRIQDAEYSARVVLLAAFAHACTRAHSVLWSWSSKLQNSVIDRHVEPDERGVLVDSFRTRIRELTTALAASEKKRDDAEHQLQECLRREQELMRKQHDVLKRCSLQQEHLVCEFKKRETALLLRIAQGS